MWSNKLICRCSASYQDELKKIIKLKKLSSIEDIQEETEAGSGCGICLDDIESLLNEKS